MFKKALLIVVGLLLSFSLLAQGERERVLTLIKILPEGQYSSIRIGGKNTRVGQTFIAGSEIQFEKGQGIVCTSIVHGETVECTFTEKDFTNKEAKSVYAYYFGSRSGSGRSLDDNITYCHESNKQGNEKRLALIVANRNYLNELNLPNTFNDMAMVKAMLLDCGFDVICLQDQTLYEIKEGVDKFAEYLEKRHYDVSFFYYAGHGVQYDRLDYIVPTDADLNNPRFIPDHCLLVNNVIDVIQGSDRKQNIILVDACREVMKDNRRGFGMESAFLCCDLKKQTSVLFSTSSTREAKDGMRGKNSPFVTSLVENSKKYSKWSEIAAHTVYDVEEETRYTYKQTPTQHGTVNPNFVFRKVEVRVPVTKVVLSKEQLSFKVGQTSTLTATVIPSNATEKNITWYSLDDGIVSVVNGKLTAHKAGVTGIVAQCDNVSAFCMVTAEADEVREEAKEPVSTATATPDINAPKLEKIKVQTFTVKGVQFKMVAVMGGIFQMGASSEQDSDAYPDEAPVHTVTLSDYMIGQTEVTQELWNIVMGNNPSYSKGPQKPVENVSWADCQNFITKLNSLTGQNFRLPTEAEWEYAARGGNRSAGYKYSGSNKLEEVAWFDGNSSSKTHPVATKAPNELGLHDMTGNVYEWCQDWYGNYRSSSQTDPQGASFGTNRVIRGGSWISFAGYLRITNRSYYTTAGQRSNLGLRLAISVEHSSSDLNEDPVLHTGVANNSSVLTVSGRVTDVNGLPIIAAEVSCPEADTKTYTDLDGHYSITVHRSETIWISLPGYKKTFVVANHANAPTVVLQEIASKKATTSAVPQSTKTTQTSENNDADRVFTVKGVKFKMVFVQGGTFQMGATNEQGSEAYSNESPVHTVTLSNYMIGQTEVTQELWSAVMGSNPSCFIGPQNPVEGVSWNYCQEFLKNLNSLTGQNFRLPTEAEWEYAARGGVKSRGYKYSGSNNIKDVAWYADGSPSNNHPVATKAANELGLYDMSGSVYEYCQDWYGKYSNGAQVNPKGPESGSYRVYRGGCGFVNAEHCRSSRRRGFNPDVGTNYHGLRLVLSLP